LTLCRSPRKKVLGPRDGRHFPLVGHPPRREYRLSGQIHTSTFYEWKKVDGGKQPYAIGLKGGGLMALAGLWETWRAPSSGERVRSFAIITTEPNELCAALHNRMPVVLAPEAWPAWLGEEPADEAQLKSLLAPYPSDGMICWPVSARVGNVRNNDAGLVEPISLP
jgi:putative SOS response-associated peptidase YedK